MSDTITTIEEPKKRKAGRPPVSDAEKEARRIRAAETKLANAGLYSEGDRRNKYRIVKGVSLKQEDIKRWTEDEYIEFLKFLDRFYEIDPLSGQVKFGVTLLKIQQAEIDLEANPEGMFAELMWRTDKFTVPYDGQVHQKFRLKVNNFMTTVFRYIKMNPVVVSDKIKDHVEGKPWYDWILSNYRLRTTAVGATVLEKNTTIMEGDERTSAPIASADKMMLDAIVKVANVYDMIATSISQNDIKKLNVKDKISALQKLSFIHGVTKNFKPNGNTFKQINIYKSGKDELEAALLDFNKEE